MPRTMKQIGKYQILQVLGKGGMGVVYKAFDPLMERNVAIKVLSEQLFDEPEIKERFYREARSAGKLSHDNITIVHDLGEVEGKPFIVMEYLTGSDLRKILKRKPDLTLMQKLEYAQQIARGLAYSHSKKIIHRDIKPENIRILDDGKVKIMDFGIARPVSSTMTRTGAVMGTPHYMSPEQIKGQTVDQQSDIFAFGVVLYELLTYRRPFEGDSPTSVSYKIVHEKSEPLHDREVEGLPAIRSIVLKCLQKDRNRRYHTISEVAADLDAAVTQLQARDQKTLAASKRKVEGLLVRCRQSLQKADFRKARVLARKAAEVADQHTPTLRGEIDALLTEIDTQQQARVDALLVSAEAHLSRKDFGRAAKVAKAVLRLSPGHPQALQLLRQSREMRAAVEAEGRTILQTRASELLRVGKRLNFGMLSLPAGRKKMLAFALTGMFVLAWLVYRIAVHVPPPANGYVALNILPWAEITKVVNQTSQEPMTFGNGPDPVLTPCLLPLPAGTYTIYLRNASYDDSLTVSVEVGAGEVTEVRERISAVDYTAILAEFR